MDVPEIHLAGVVDPAEHSDRAVAVFEVPEADYDPGYLADLVVQIEREIGMRAVVTVGGRFLGVEEPDDDAEAD